MLTWSLLVLLQLSHISAEIIKVNVSTGSTYLDVSWEETKEGVNYTLGYGIPDNITYQEIDYTLTPDNIASYQIDNLSPGVTYTLQLKKDGTEVFKSTGTTKPLPPASLIVSDAGTDYLYLTWQGNSQSTQDSYRVTVTETNNNSELFKSDPLTVEYHNLTNLYPGALYSIAVDSISNDVYSNGTARIIDNTRPLPPTIHWIMAIDNYTLMLAWKEDFNSQQDHVYLSAIYNNTFSYEGEMNLTCTMLLSTCVTEVRGVIPGTPIEIRAYSVQNNRRSDPDIAFHSTKPETVTSLLETSSTTSTLELSVTPPFTSVFVNYSVSIDDGYFYFRNYTYPASHTTFTIGNLSAGIEYNVSVGTVSEWEESRNQFSRIFYTNPNMPGDIDILTKDILTTSLKISWGHVESGQLDYYEVVISPKEPQTQSPVLQYNTDERNVKFDSLVPGRKYSITVTAVKGQKKNSTNTVEQYTKPNPPSKIIHTVIGGREIHLDWFKPIIGEVENYTISIVSLGINGTTNTTLPIAPVTLAGTSYSFTQLHPGETYEISIVCNSGGETSDPLKITATTNATSVSELFVDHVTEDYINISWSRPENLTFQTFKLTINPPDATTPVSIQESAGILFHSFTGLQPGTVYNLSIYLISGTSVIDKSERTAITNPLPVDDINITTHDTSSLLIDWSITKPLQQHHFEIVYEENNDSENITLPMVLALHDKTSYQSHIMRLTAGSLYTIHIRAVQEFNDLKSYSSWVTMNKTTKPNSVTELKASVSGQDAMLSWKPNINSTQDSFYIWYRPILNLSSFWRQTFTRDLQTTLKGMFAGERYEFIVFAVSIGEMSLPRNVFAEVLPLSPQDVTTSDILIDSLTLTWSYNKSSTFIEEFELTYTGYHSNSEGMITVDGGNSTSSVTLSSLKSGESYEISITSQTGNLTSEATSMNVTIKPECLTVLTENTALTTSDVITIQYTPVVNQFDHYQFTLINDTQRSPVMKSRGDKNRLVTFDRLTGGSLYVVGVLAVSDTQISDIRSISIFTAPNRPHVEQISTATEITLIINKPPGRVDSYLIVCALNSVPCSSNTIDASQDKITLPFVKLTPYQKYKFQIVTFAGLKNVSFFMNIETAQAAPSVVQNLHAKETQPREVVLTWNAPRVTNGIITAYIVEYRGRRNDMEPVIDSNVRTIMVDSTSAFSDPIEYTLKDLTAGLKYVFMVYAKTIINGPSVSSLLTTRTYNPKLKDGVSSDMAAPTTPEDKTSSVTPSTITARFTNAFSDEYGEIIQYTIIVATNTDEDYLNTNTLPGWKAYQNDPSIKAYQAVSNCSDFFVLESTCNDRLRVQKRSVGEEEYKTFVIGSETNCKDPHYCNGPLKQNTEYYVKLRAYTTGGYADTVYSLPFRTGSVTEESSYGGIIGGIVAAVVIIALILFAVLFLRRNIRSKSNMYRQGHDHRMTPRSSMRSHKKKHEINIANFRDHVMTMSADSDFKYAEEFEDLKEIGREQSCSAAELPVNRGKNRFTNILPYDHSRVKLLPTDDEEGSDYINANYMPGFNSKREYIVTQGPLPSTRDDFWRMIWEQNSRNVVMLTKCVEKGREKCDQYWPSGSDAMFYGDIQVAVLNETKFPSWTVTEFRIALGDLTRQVRHFHFTAWPDFGVPDKPQTLIRFVRIVREKLIRECGPIVVHCSAGVGRSGTFIGLDRLLQDILDRDIIDIFNVVAEMRRERVWMVQTEQQYVCIHQCLMCVLDGKEEEHVYVNSGNVNQAFEDDEGINVEVP
ncbi:tyrosine-protein phosphatase 10D-like isoform X1 [Mytilus trossulus]|uniref:tyrosine-protein phosphatase 10D-like isoform X1 n=1 Tax=Mytilus trossulus TaxID=6551 RepID=UPI0030042761